MRFLFVTIIFSRKGSKPAVCSGGIKELVKWVCVRVGIFVNR